MEKEIVCGIIPSGCGHRDWKYKYGCDKEDLACAIRNQDPYNLTEGKDGEETNI